MHEALENLLSLEKQTRLVSHSVHSFSRSVSLVADAKGIRQQQKQLSWENPWVIKGTKNNLCTSIYHCVGQKDQ